MSAIAYYAEALIENESVVISRGLRRRDPDLLDRRIERYQHRLYRYLVFLTRDWQLSEDLFQETWMRVLQKRLAVRSALQVCRMALGSGPQSRDRRDAAPEPGYDGGVESDR